MRAIERRVLEAIDVDAMLDFLCRLVAVRSLSGQETAAQKSVAAKMEECGLETTVWDLDLDTLARHPAHCAEVQREHGLGVIGTLGQGVGGRSLILNGHTDVVPAGDESRWSHPPWQGTIHEGRVWGRGAVDMKGGLCSALFAAKALRDASVGLRGRLIVQSVIGEEDGGVGTLAAIFHGPRANGAVVIEPTELAIVPAQAGALNFRITVQGSSAHACVREEGVSAVEKFHAIHQSLLDLERERNESMRHPLYAKYRLPWPLSIGTVRAGDWPSSVPERLTCEGRFGIAVGEEVGRARQVLERTVAQAARRDPWLREHPPIVEWWGGQYEPAEIEQDHPLVETLRQAHREISDAPVRIEGVTYGSDMRLLVNEGGIPTVLFGPGDVRRSHRPDEFVPVEDLVTATRTLALMALRFCS